MNRRDLLKAAAGLAVMPSMVDAASVERGTSQHGAAGDQLGTITMHDLSGAARSGTIPVNFVYPLGAGDLPAGRKIAIYDGTTALDVQEENWSSDRSGNKRIVMGTAMWRSARLSANGSKQLTVKTVAGSPLTGTAITDADILATDFDVGVTLTFPDGTLYKAAARDILGASSDWSGTNNGGNPQRKGTYKSGPFMVEIVGSSSLKTGGTPHPFLRVQWHIEAFKAATGAVSGGNPILYIRTYAGFDNGYLKVGSPADLLYGAVVTVGHATPVNIAREGTNPGNIDLSTQTPAATLTITGSATLGAVSAANAARSAGAWTADDIGRVIEDNSGKQLRIGANGHASFVNSTNVTVNNYQGVGNDGTFSTGFWGTPIPNGTYTSGNWKQYGICHLYGGRWYAKVWWGANADHLTIPDWTQMRASKVFPNWSAPIGNYAAADMTQLNTQGVAGTRYKRPFRGIGDFGLDFDEGGQHDTEYINLIPDWFHRLCQNFNTNDLRKLEENAQTYMTLGYGFRDDLTGDFVDFTDASTPRNNLAWHAATSANHPTPPTTRYSWWYWRYGGIEDSTHLADPFFPLWFLSGDYMWLEQQMLMAERSWLWIGPPGNVGYARSVLHCGPLALIQERDCAWHLRTLYHIVIATPDAFALSIYTKSFMQAWIDAQMSFAASSIITNAAFNAHGPKCVALDANGNPAGIGFGNVYMFHMLIHAKENGLLDTNGQAFFDWYMQSAIAGTETTGINALANPLFWGATYNANINLSTDGKQASFNVTDFAKWYEGVAKGQGFFNSYGNYYGLHGKTITAINASNPAAVLLTFNSAYFLPVSPVNTWYVGGWVMTKDRNILTGASWAATGGGQVTFTTTTLHNMAVGKPFSISGLSPFGYNGGFVAIAGTTGSTLVAALASNPGAVIALGHLNGAIGLITAVSADGTQATVDTTVTTPTYVQNGSTFPAAAYATSTNILLPMPHPAVWPATLYSFSDSVMGASVIGAQYFARTPSALAALCELGSSPTIRSDALAGWNLLKHHWEVDDKLGVGVLPSDAGPPAAPNLVDGGTFGAHCAGKLITPR